MKKIGSLVLVGCLGLTLTGCKKDLDYMEKEITKMEEKLEELKNEDYSVHMEQVSAGRYTLNKTVNKDGKNYYVRSHTVYEDETVIVERWFEHKSGNKYTIYVQYTEGNLKGELKKQEIEIVSAGDYDLLDLPYFYDEGIGATNEAINTCKNNEGGSCEVNKSLFGKVTFEYDSDEFDFKLVSNKGKIIEIYAEEEDERYSDNNKFDISIEYKDQTVKIPE